LRSLKLKNIFKELCHGEKDAAVTLFCGISVAGR
jgi:hypothetical protein